MTRLRQADLVTLAGLVESRNVTPVIGSRHRLSETSEAFRRLATGHAAGRIIVTVGPSDTLGES
jgi:D-arabinose 1-dehydrogenase-like Zn-dependent alcohol dehydrogenase